MKKIVSSLVLASVLASCALVCANPLKSAYSGVAGNIKNHPIMWGGGALGATATGIIAYDLLKNQARMLKKLAVLAKKGGQKAGKHYAVTAATLTVLAAATGVALEVLLRGDNSCCRAVYNKLFSKKEEKKTKE